MELNRFLNICFLVGSVVFLIDWSSAVAGGRRDGLVKFDPAKMPYRDAYRVFPSINDKENGDYILQRHDAIEFDVIERPLSILQTSHLVDQRPITKGREDDEVHLRPTTVSVQTTFTPMLKDIRKPRVPVWILEDYTKTRPLVIEDVESKEEIFFKVPIISGRTSWSDFQKLIQEANANAPDSFGSQYELLAHLLTSEPIRLAPGDGVTVTRVVQLTEPAVDPADEWRRLSRQISESHDLRVDSNGYLFIPPLARIFFKNWAKIQTSAKLRRVDAALDSTHFRVPVWRAGVALNQVPTLNDIALCLSQGNSQTACSTDIMPSNDVTGQKCIALGISRASLQPGCLTHRHTRYFLEPEKRHWVLANENNRSMEAEYRWGTSVADGVRDHFEKLFGAPLNADTPFRRTAYVIVYPDPDQSNRQAFWGEISLDRTSLLERAALVASDRIVVTRDHPSVR